MVCSFFALGILGYFVFKSPSDNVMVGSKKFVKVQSVQNATTYSVTVENEESVKTEAVFYSVKKQESNIPNICNYTISVSLDGKTLLAEEHYQREITRTNSQTGKIDCKIKNYKINFFSNDEVVKTLNFVDQELVDVSPDFFCCVVSEYVGDFFSQDGNYKVIILALDSDGQIIIDDNGNEAKEIVDYNFKAYYEQDFSRRANYYYDGKWGSYVISSKDELDRFVKWAILYRQGNGKDITFYIKTKEITPGNINSLVTDSVYDYPEYDALEENSQYAKMVGNIGILTNFNYYLSENFLKTYKDLKEIDYSYNNANYNTATQFLHKKDENFAPTYITKTSDVREFAIDDAEDEVVVYNTEQLFMVVQSGAKPIFVEGKSDVAKTVYDNALDVLRNINNSNTLTPYEKTLNIYNYICGEIVYDYVTYKYMELTGDLTIKSFGDYSCFYLEGVFYDFGNGTQYAVCDGLAKAISLMCNIEGVECFKVNGQIVGSSNHAWNKVHLVDDEYDIDDWFYIDPTWGEGTYVSSGENYQVLTHSYFLFAHDDRERTIIYPEDSELYHKGQNYEYYKNTTRDLDDKKISLYVENDEDLMDNFTISQNELSGDKTSTILELKFSLDYLSVQDSKMAKLIELYSSLNTISNKISHIDKQISNMEIEMQWAINRLERLGVDEESIAKERADWQSKINEMNSEREQYSTQYNEKVDELKTWFKGCGVTSKWEWIVTDGDNTLSIFRFYK